jgi:hypothetical protein
MSIRVISLGAGVQSTALSLMARDGVIGPMPDCAVFADTGWEPEGVYRHLGWLEGVLPFPVYRVSAGDLRQDQLDRSNTTGHRFAAVPWFMLSPKNKAGMGRRQCTREYKLGPIHRKVKELMGGRPKAGCEMWIGISLDEAMRMRPSRVQYIVNRFPLLEKRINRKQCLEWLEANGYPKPPKSACIGCPFHSDKAWREMKDNRPDEWADAVEVDKVIRHQPGFRGQQFMHKSMLPLEQVDLSTPEDHGQLNLFNNECEGMCGV